MQEQLSELTQRLQTTFGGHLIAAILYGSAAMGDWNEHSSDLNILCVLDQLSPEELSKWEPIFAWWRKKGNPPPLLLTAEEVRTSTDCFPIEFHDMQEHRRVLCGIDVIQNLEIDRSFYRAQVEHELRAKQIRLRQKAAEALSNSERLTQLLVDSISTFCVLGRHALILSGHAPCWKKAEIISSLEDATRTPFPASNAILAIRGNRQRRDKNEAISLLKDYLGEVDVLVRFVDGLNK